MDRTILFPKPSNDSLREEISKSFKLHCSNVEYGEEGHNIDNILNEVSFKKPFIQAGQVAKNVVNENLITTNHIDRNTEYAIDFETDPVESINRNKYIQKIKDVNEGLYNLIYNGLNNGVFFRNAKTRRSFNYWQPLSNAGIPAVPRGDEIHETTFLVHDIMHNLIPDLQIDKNDELNKAVYIIHRVLGEGICLILADMYFIDALSQKVEYDFEKKNIYQAFKHIKHRSLYDNLKANGIYAVTGIKSFFGTNHTEVEKYLEWFRPVYISDLKWTLHNVEDICSNFEKHMEWLENTKPFIDETAYEMITTEHIINKLNITKEDSILTMTSKIFDFIYDSYILNNLKEIKSTTKDLRSLKAKNIFYAFQSKLLFIYGKENDFMKFMNPLSDSSFDKVEHIYQTELVSLFIEEKINEDDFRVFKEVYPHFNSFFISYDADKVVPMTLKDYSNELFFKLFNKGE